MIGIKRPLDLNMLTSADPYIGEANQFRCFADSTNLAV